MDLRKYNPKTDKCLVKTCKACNVTSDDFYPNRRLCRPCYLKKNKQYVNTPTGSANARAAKARYKHTTKGLISNAASNKNRQLRNKQIIDAGINAVVHNIIPPIKFVRNLGCSWDEFKRYIEYHRTATMRLEDYKVTWIIKTKIPVEFFNLRSPKQFKKACHYSNFIVMKLHERPWHRPTPDRWPIKLMDPIDMDELLVATYYDLVCDTFPEID